MGAYVVDGFIDTGGMAFVLEVHHQVLGSRHALKVLRPDLVHDDAMRARFLEEGRVQAQLRHPGLVRVTDLVSEPGVAGLVMDFLEGQSLSARLHRGRVPVEDACTWVFQALNAMAYAHERGIVHRDLKPSNIFLRRREDARPVACVLDFGIAKVVARGRTASQATLGTYAYMAPEQIRDPKTVDLRADIFSLGAVLYEACIGVQPFEQETDYRTMQAIVSGEYVRACDQPLVVELAAAIDIALASDPAERFANCSAFARVLRPFVPAEELALVDSWRGDGDYRPAPRDEPPPVARPPSLQYEDDEEAADEGIPIEPTWDPHTEDQDRASVAEELQALARVRNPDTRPDVFDELDIPQVPARVEPEVVASEVDRERQERLTRIAAGLQVVSGIANVGIMWFIACAGWGTLSVSIATCLGIPGWISWIGYATGVIGLVLFVVGLAELTSGFAVLMGARARWWVRVVAWLELSSVVFGGLHSALVGLLAMALTSRALSRDTLGE